MIEGKYAEECRSIPYKFSYFWTSH